MISSLIRKWKFRKKMKEYKSKAMDALVKNFLHCFYLRENSMSWDLKSFNKPKKLFNINGQKDSFKFPVYFVLKDEDICFIFSGLKMGCDTYKKMSGEFDSLDDSFVRRFKEFVVVNNMKLDDIMESDRECYTIDECIDKFERLYLTAVCDLNKPSDILYLDDQIYLHKMHKKIKKKLIDNHVGEK